MSGSQPNSSEAILRVWRSPSTWFKASIDGAVLLFALVVGLIFGLGLEAVSPVPRGENLTSMMVASLAWGAPLLLALGVSAYWIAGFYSHGRAYRGKHKLRYVVATSAIVQVLFILIASFIPGTLFTPSSLFVTAFLATTLVVVSRLGAEIWRSLEHSESRMRSQRDALDGKVPRSVLVIGGAGYIGSALLPKLLAAGYRVRLLDVFQFGDEAIRKVLGHRNLEIVKADFRRVDKIVDAMYGMDAIIHLGAVVGDPACALDETYTIEINLQATRMIAECAKGLGISRFIFASTCSVYGASDDYLDEKSNLNPVSLYARSKIACEKILTSMADDSFCPTILRFGTVYGLSGRTRFDLVVNLLVAKAVCDGVITVHGEDQWRPFLHVDDAALAVSTVLGAKLSIVGHEVFNVGSDHENMTLGDVGRKIKAKVPTAELILGAVDGDRRNYRVNFSKLRDATGFQAQWTVDKGIDQVLEAFESGKVKDYHDPRYSNVKYLLSHAATHGLSKDADVIQDLVTNLEAEIPRAQSF